MAIGKRWKNSSGTKIYFIWRSMRSRCRDKRNKNYGGKGIKVCKAWLNDYDVFYSWAMKSGYKKGLSLDRINSDRDYKPSNCRFVPLKEQHSNEKRNIWINYKGKTLTIAQWCRRLKLKADTVYRRYNRFGARTYEELFLKGRLHSFRVSKMLRKCVNCGISKSIKWRKSFCNTCYARYLRNKRKKLLTENFY